MPILDWMNKKQALTGKCLFLMVTKSDYEEKIRKIVK